VDYNLMSNLPGLFVIGEANFSDHGANRLGASALMQGLADGYFILPYTIGDYLVSAKTKVSADQPEFKKSQTDINDQIAKFLSINGKRTPDSFHRELGHIMWEHCGMARTDESLKKALAKIPALRDEFWKNLRVLGTGTGVNNSLEKAGRVADFLEFAELLCQDALNRKESCGGHFREEYQTEDGEAKRDDQNYSYVAAWEYKGKGALPVLHKEELVFEEVHLAQRSYK
jgi:succinate dehydrogenase / fumarate reductase flavoprotein subunit